MQSGSPWPWDLLRPIVRAGLRDLRGRGSFDGAAVHVVEGPSLVIAATDPPIRFGSRAARSPADQGPAGRALASDEPVYLPDLRTEPGLRTPFDQGLTSGARTYLGTPLRAHGSVLGVLQVDSRRPDAFPPAARERLLETVPPLEIALHGALPHEGESFGDRELVSAILSVVSHELRGPATSIRGLAETLMARAGGGDPELVEELAGRIAGASVRLQRLVADLLDIARLDGGISVVVVDTDVEPIVREVAELPTSPPHEVQVEVAPDVPKALADPDRLHQVLENLIGNAAKFSTPGLPIEIEVAPDEDRVAIRVRDHGEGIPPELLERIFEPFTRGPRAGRPDPGGMGLGLFLVRDLCHAMGADVDVASTAGEGATFTVRLATAREDAETPDRAADG